MMIWCMIPCPHGGQLRESTMNLAKIKTEWQAYNKRYRHDKRMQMTFDAYCDWLYGKKQNVKTTNIPIVEKPVWANTTDHIASLKSKNGGIHPKNSMMDKVQLGAITGKDAEMIIQKSKRIGLITSKGAYGYIDDSIDLKSLGKKTQQLE